MILYVDAQYLSPYAMSAYVALTVKKVDFKVVPVDLSSGEARDPGFLQRSLTGRIPMLDTGRICIAESSAIAEFLEDTVAETSLYPRHPEQKAQARQIQAWLRSDLLALRQERNTEVVFRHPAERPLSAEALHAVRRLVRVATKLVPSDRHFLFEQWSIADVDLALMLQRLRFDRDALPEHLAQYAQTQWQHPAVQSWLGRHRHA